MSEANIVAAGRRRLARRGAWDIKTTGVAVAGIPDNLFCYRGRFGAIEWKQHPNKPTPAQLRQLELIRRAGGHTLVGYHPDDADRLLDEIDTQLDHQEPA